MLAGEEEAAVAAAALEVHTSMVAAGEAGREGRKGEESAPLVAHGAGRQAGPGVFSLLLLLPPLPPRQRKGALPVWGGRGRRRRREARKTKRGGRGGEQKQDGE